MRFLLCLLMIAAGAWGQTTEKVETTAFRGMLYVPAGVAKPVGIVFIGGSEGHLYQARENGPALAKAGYVTLAVDYHDGYDPGRKLNKVPVEMFTAAVEWLRTSTAKPARVVVMGDSRGSEAALLTGIYDANVAGVVAVVPSSVLWGATTNTDSKKDAAWTWQGKPLPCLDCLEGKPGFTMAQMLDGAGFEEARIPVETLHGAVFLAGSDADAVWPSARMAREVAARLAREHFAYPVVLMTFPDSSHHMLGEGPKNPVESYEFQGKTYTSNAGGTAAGTERARNATWAGILNFLEMVGRLGP